MSSARTRGFSLIELMITITVVAILTAIAWPNFRDFMHRNTATSQANQVLAALQYARNEAVSRRYPTALCGSTSGSACAPSDTDFENGWMIWRDSTLSGTPKYDDPTKDELLRVAQAQTGVSIRSFGGSGSAALIAFDQRGAVIGAGGGTTNIVICAKNSSSDPLGSNSERVPGKYVRVDASGRITVQSLAASDKCDAAPGS
jgi:type IV fimbrial biogenesis protein FimT